MDSMDSLEETRSPLAYPFGVLAINRKGEFRIRWFKDQSEYLARTAKSTMHLFGCEVFLDHFGDTRRAAVENSVVNLTAYEALAVQDARELLAWLNDRSLYAIAWVGDSRELFEESTNVFLQACNDHIRNLLGAPLTLQLLKSREAVVIHAINQLPKMSFFSVG